eukprot:m.136369 g.136369  ORF g.136369 m.136369 type:complete len:224 (-) comp10639_c0_seq1:1887-2558(-)
MTSAHDEKEARITSRSGVLRSSAQIVERLTSNKSAALTTLENALELQKLFEIQEEIKKFFPKQEHVKAIVESDGMDQQFMKDLVAENRELHLMMDTMQEGMHVIAKQRRDQVRQLAFANEDLSISAQHAVENEKAQSRKLEDEITHLNAKIEEMQAVMCAAVAADGKAEDDMYALVSKVEEENERLRELLDVSTNLGFHSDDEGEEEQDSNTENEGESATTSS